MTARVAVPQTAPYPRAATLAGVRACKMGDVSGDTPADVLVTWTPWQETVREAAARRHRIVIVMENGWWTPLRDQTYYQVALGGFNGQGQYFTDPRRTLPTPVDRRSLVFEHGPWLVVGQRGGGPDPRAMPPEWPNVAAAKLNGQALIHPKGEGEPPALIMERIRPRAVVTWSSNFASWALWHDVPVFYAGPSIMVQAVARRWHEAMKAPTPYRVDRERVDALFNDLAWAQWTAEEIATGYPFARLLNMRNDP